ncbi:MAG TPA: hypothetical protein DEP35_10710 [Deltaproteobacteria bacterium]|nr:hypothetical protein [Deltaproteobacteria bacterium]
MQPLQNEFLAGSFIREGSCKAMQSQTVMAGLGFRKLRSLAAESVSLIPVRTSLANRVPRITEGSPPSSRVAALAVG